MNRVVRLEESSSNAIRISPSFSRSRIFSNGKFCTNSVCAGEGACIGGANWRCGPTWLGDKKQRHVARGALCACITTAHGVRSCNRRSGGSGGHGGRVSISVQASRRCALAGLALPQRCTNLQRHNLLGVNRQRLLQLGKHFFGWVARVRESIPRSKACCNFWKG